DLAAEEDDVRSGDARRPRAGPLGPWQRGAVRLRGISGRNHESRLALWRVAQLAEPLDGAAEGELGAAEALDEVPAAAETERLERTQLGVHRAVAAGDALGADGVPRDDPVPLEQQLGERAALTGARAEPPR